MLEHQSIVDVDKVVNLGLAGFAWAFVLVESLSKRVDVPALKSQLDVRDAQVMASVIAEIEVEVLPYLGSPPSNPKIGEVDDELDELEDEDYDFPTVLGEGAKDALARSLRKSPSKPRKKPRKRAARSSSRRSSVTRPSRPATTPSAPSPSPATT